MSEHRPRLTESELSLVVSALRARLAMRQGTRRREAERLIERLEDLGRGNPTFRFGWETPLDRAERVGPPAAEANERLIAAAPTLLEACRAMVGAFGSGADPVRAQAVTAIAKAAGGTL